MPGVREAALSGALPEDARLTASIFTDSFTYPSVNVIARVPGRDPKLREEHVLFSAHQDHDGERYSVVQFCHPTPWTILAPLPSTVTTCMRLG